MTSVYDAPYTYEGLRTPGLYDHPLMRHIRDVQLRTGRLSMEYTITLEEARSLRRHLKMVDPPAASPPDLAEPQPGRRFTMVAGVQLIVEAPRLLAVHRGGQGKAGIWAVADHLAPAGTVPGKLTRVFVTVEAAADDAVRTYIRDEIGRRIGEPHVILDLGATDLTEQEQPPEGHPQRSNPGWRLLLGFTLRAVRTDHIVLRMAADAPPGVSLGKADGRWVPRPPKSLAVVVWRDGDIEQALTRPTGRIEVNGDGQIAEVWEVTG